MDSELAALLSGFPVVISLPVQWGDQDAFGHVNNTPYFRWFESARIAYGMRVGLSRLKATQNIGPILALITCDYRRQLTFPDTVHVGARITRIGRSSLTMEHRLISEAGRRRRRRGDLGHRRLRLQPEPILSRPRRDPPGHRPVGRPRLLNVAQPPPAGSELIR